MDLFGELFTEILQGPVVQRALDVIGIVTFVLAIALVFWLFRDARRRGSLSILWGLVGTAALVVGVFIGFGVEGWGFASVGLASLVLVLVVLVVYTFLRPADFAADAQERELSQRLLEAELETHACPSCGGGIEVDFLICPNCNVTLRRPCDYCSRPIKTGWATCPYCRASKGQGETRAASAAGGGAAKGKRAAAPRGDSNPTTRKRPAPARGAGGSSGGSAASEDDIDLDFDAPKTGNVGRAQTKSGGRSSSGSRSSGTRSSGSAGSGAGRSRTSTGSSSDASSSTFKD